MIWYFLVASLKEFRSPSMLLVLATSLGTKHAGGSINSSIIILLLRTRRRGYHSNESTKESPCRRHHLGLVLFQSVPAGRFGAATVWQIVGKDDANGNGRGGGYNSIGYGIRLTLFLLHPKRESFGIQSKLMAFLHTPRRKKNRHKSV